MGVSCSNPPSPAANVNVNVDVIANVNATKEDVVTLGGVFEVLLT